MLGNAGMEFCYHGGLYVRGKGSLFTAEGERSPGTRGTQGGMEGRGRVTCGLGITAGLRVGPEQRQVKEWHV